MADSLLDLGSNTTILEYEPEWSRDITTERLLLNNLLKFEGTAGEFQVYDLDQPRAIQWGFKEKSSSANDVIKFFFNRYGAYESFWLPDKVKAFEPYGNQTTDNLIVEPDTKFSETIRGFERIIITLTNGDRLTRKIDSVSETVDYLTLVLHSALGRTITESEFVSVAFLYYVRFDLDELDINYSTVSVPEFVFEFQELTKEYPELP